MHRSTFLPLQHAATLIFSVDWGLWVRARNGGGDGDPSAATATPKAKPAAPTSLSATPGDGQVILSWTAMTGVTGWQYQYQSEGVAPTGWAAVTGGGGATSVTVTGLTNETVHTFRVRAKNLSRYPVVVYAIPRVPGLLPANLRATAGSGQVTLSWDALPAGVTVTGWQYIYKAGTDAWTGWTDVTGGGSATTVTVTGLTNDTGYTFRVRAKNLSRIPAVVYALPRGAEGGRRLAPSAPTGVAATPGDGQVRLSWNAMAGVTGWQYQYQSEGVAPTSWAAVSGGGGATSVTVTGLTNDTGYTLWVRARNGGGDGDPSAATATPKAKPAAPTSLSATPGDGQVILSWNAMAGVTGWQYQYQSEGVAYTGWAAVSGEGGATSVTVTGLTNDTAYTFQRRRQPRGFRRLPRMRSLP